MEAGYRPDVAEGLLMQKVYSPAVPTGMTDSHPGLEAEASRPSGENRIAQQDVLSSGVLRKAAEGQKIFPANHHVAGRERTGGSLFPGRDVVRELEPVVGRGNPAAGVEVQDRSTSKMNCGVGNGFPAPGQPIGVRDAIGVDERNQASSGAREPTVAGGARHQRFRGSRQLNAREFPGGPRDRVILCAVHHDQLELEPRTLPHHAGEAVPELGRVAPARDDDAEIGQAGALRSTWR